MWYYRYMERSVYKLFLILTILISAFAFVGDVQARNNEENQTDLNINVESIIMASISYTPITFEANNNLHTSPMDVSIISNNETGFVTTMSTNHMSSEPNATDLVNDDSDGYISTLASSVSSSSFTMNKWGYSIDSGSTFKPLTPKDGVQATIMSSDRAGTTNSKRILFGVKADNTTAPGTYISTVLFTTVPNPTPLDLSKITYMQEVTAEVCANTRTVTASETTTVPQYRLIDNRDGQAYWVAKLADGKCWMTQNLNLNLTNNYSYDVVQPYQSTELQSTELMGGSTTKPFSGIVLTDADTDLNTETSYNVLDNNTIHTTGNIFFNGKEAECQKSKDDHIDGLWFGDAAEELCPELFTGDNELTGYHGRVGVFYDDSVATAGWDASVHVYGNNTSYSENSICPRGWTLPEETDYDNLGSTYSNVNNFFGAPFYFVPAGKVSGDRNNWTFREIGWTAYMQVRQWGHANGISVDTYRASDYEISKTAIQAISRRNDASDKKHTVRCIARGAYNSLRYDTNGGKWVNDDVPLRENDFENSSMTLTITENYPYYENGSERRIFLGWSTNKDATTPTYGYTSDNLQTSITFSGDITLYAVWGRSTGATPEYMQDMTSSICESMGLNEERLLTDKRDNKQYWVTKLKDGKCWMTQNLDLDLKTTVALTSDTSDLNTVSSWTPTRNTGTAYSGWTTGVTTSHYSYDPGDMIFVLGTMGTTRYFISTTAKNGCTNITGTNCYKAQSNTGSVKVGYAAKNTVNTLLYGSTTGNMLTAGREQTSHHSVIYYQNGDREIELPIKYSDPSTSIGGQIYIGKEYDGLLHLHAGNYYTFTAAVASDDSSTIPIGEAPNSICPKGWKLPSRAEMENFTQYYNAKTMMNYPFYATKNSSINGSLAWAYVDVKYMTSTLRTSTTTNNLYSFDTLDDPVQDYVAIDSVAHSTGMSIRCIAR